MASNPKVVVILSGKRKSGKDFVADILSEHIAEKVFIRIAGPIKKQYTQDHGLDYQKSLTASGYKETFRADMVRWSEEVREKDQNIFLRKSIEEEQAHVKPVWILTDARRTTDIEFFQTDQFKDCKVIRIRVMVNNEVRSARGWVFTPGTDDKPTECGLDDYKDWDHVIVNDTTAEELLLKLQPIVEACKAVQ